MARRKAIAVIAHPAPIAVEDVDDAPVASELPPVPEGWSKGEMLNLRRTNAGYILTRIHEEYNPRHPERSMFFANTGNCQHFISNWYAREAHDPRAV